MLMFLASVDDVVNGVVDVVAAVVVVFDVAVDVVAVDVAVAIDVFDVHIRIYIYTHVFICFVLC